jgi:phage-related protein
MPVAALAGLGQVTAVFSGITGQLALATNTVRGFVDALNPQAGARLDKALYDLQATIGYALEPVIQVAADVVNQFAGAIVGAMDALRPAIEHVSALFQRVLGPVMRIVKVLFDSLASSIDALMPLFDFLASWMEGALSVLQVVITVFEVLRVAFLQFIMGPMGGLSDVSKFLTDVFVGLAEAVLQTTAFFLELIGQEDEMKKILEKIVEQMPGKGRAGAMTGYGIGGLEDVYRRRLVASAQAMGGGTVEQQQLGVMEKIQALCEKMLVEMGGEVPKRPETAQDRLRERQAANGAGGEFGDWGED